MLVSLFSRYSTCTRYGRFHLRSSSARAWYVLYGQDKSQSKISVNESASSITAYNYGVLSYSEYVTRGYHTEMRYCLKHTPSVQGCLEGADQFRMQQKVNVNAKNDDGLTALMMASSNGHVQVVCESWQTGSDWCFETGKAAKLKGRNSLDCVAMDRGLSSFSRHGLHFLCYLYCGDTTF